MGRPRRFRLPDIPQLVSQRGHNRLPCFIDGDDFRRFREVLHESAHHYQCRVDALLMLPEGYWTVLVPASDDGLAQTLQRTGRLYVRHANRKYRRLGTLWAERYRACPVEPSALWLARVGCFLAAMPQRRGMLQDGQRWPWWETALPEAETTEADAAASASIESALRRGLVVGSDDFLAEMARRSGQPTTPRRRGRPPRRG